MFCAVGSLGSGVKLREENTTSYLEKILRLVNLITDSPAVTLGEDVLGLRLGPSPLSARDPPLRRSPTGHQ